MESMHNSAPDPRPTEVMLEPDPAQLDALAKEKYHKRLKRGMRWMGIGALILVLSFGLNFLIYQCGGDCTVPMYLLTSVGALCCLKGMMDIF